MGASGFVRADDRASLYAALPGGPADIRTVFYGVEGVEVARRVSQGARRFATLENRDQGLWPRVGRIVTATLQGAVLRDIEVVRDEDSYAA